MKNFYAFWLGIILFAFATACTTPSTNIPTEDSQQGELSQEATPSNTISPINTPPIPTESSTPTVLPTVTNTPEPSPTQTSTAVPTSTQTPEATSTAVGCNIDPFTEAVSALEQLSSYRNQITASSIIPDEIIPVIELDLATVQENGIAKAIDASMAVYAEDDMNMNILIFDDNAYFEIIGEQGWQAISGELGLSLLDRFTESQYVSSELIEILENNPCETLQVIDENIENLFASVYKFEEIDINSISYIEEYLQEVPSAVIQPAEIEIWLVEIEDLIVPTKFILKYGIEGIDIENFEFLISQNITDINKDFDIQPPIGIETPKFFIDLPLPENTEISTEGENILVLATGLYSDEVLAFYEAYLLEEQWEYSESLEEEQDGITFYGFTYTKDGNEIAIGAADLEEYTIISIAGGPKKP